MAMLQLQGHAPAKPEHGILIVRMAMIILLWVAALIAAALLDRQVATWARDSGVEQFLRDDQRWLRETLKAPGEFWFTLATALVVTFVHPLKWRAGAFLFLATLICSANEVIKWLVGRIRPFKWDEAGRLAPFDFRPFRGGLGGFFDSRNLCFPSGHTALAFATAAGLAILWPRARWVFYAVACVVAAERFAENAHWLSDTVAAAALGAGGAHVIRWLLGSRLLDERGASRELPVAVAHR